MLLSCAHFMYAQRDSIVLKPVTVYGLPEDKYLAGSSVAGMDSSLQRNYQSSHLGEVLSIQFPVYFRNYGNGMISGISMRGTSPQHTAVLWNGININSFSLGQADFSLLPSIVFDEVKVHEGGGSARYGSGAFGGAVLLNSSAPTTHSLFTLKQEAGSFGRYFSSARISLGKGLWSSSTSFYRLHSQNDFKINRTNERQQHASFTQQGIVQDMEYALSANRSISLHYWYHDADREVQPNIGKYNSTDEQQDRNHRLSIGYQQHESWGKLKAGGGLVDDVIVFNGGKTEIFRWVAFANHQYTFFKEWHVQFSTDWNHIIGKIKEYGGEPVEDRVDVAAALQRDFKKYSFSFNLRQPFITHANAPLLPYLGADLRLVDRTSYQLSLNLNASKNFRAPTMNDRYWQNAGRTDLKPETSHAAEAGLIWQQMKFKWSVKGFYQLVDQWIQWVPDASAVYRPENIKQVKARGLETSMALKQQYGKLIVRSTLGYQYTRSTASKAPVTETSALGKQLVYTPIHVGNAVITTQWKTWQANAFAQYSGKRFTEFSNSDVYALDAYVLIDVSIEKQISLRRNRLSCQAAIKNVTNQIYQQYAGRAMPGRYFNFQLSYQLKTK